MWKEATKATNWAGMMKTQIFFYEKEKQTSCCRWRGEEKKINQRQNENYMYTLTHGKHNIAHWIQ